MTRAEHVSMIMKARADMMRAQAEMVKAQAELLKAQAQARTAFFEAAKVRQNVKALAMQNELKHVSTHFEKKAIRKAHLQRSRRRTVMPTSSENDTIEVLAVASR